MHSWAQQQADTITGVAAAEEGQEGQVMEQAALQHCPARRVLLNCPGHRICGAAVWLMGEVLPWTLCA